MSLPALLLLNEFLDVPKSQIGSVAAEFATLHRHHLPLPPMMVVPKSSLQRVAELNQLLKKVEKLFKKKRSSSELQQELVRVVTAQQLPPDLSTDLARKYHGYCKQGYVSLLTSPVTPGAPSLSDENLKGEATLQEAVLELWAKVLREQVLQLQRGTLTLDKLLPVAVIIQKQPEAVVSGTGYTRHPLTGDRSVVLIQSVWGNRVMPLSTGEGDAFEVDTRTYHVVRKNIRKQTTRQQLTLGGFETKPLTKTQASANSTLTVKQLERVARVLFQLKQKRLHHYRVQWVLENETIYCLRCTELEPVTTHPTNTHKTITKVYASIHSSKVLTPELTAQLDGTFLRLEYTYAKFGMHPLAALQNNYHKLLKKELTTLITTTLQQQGNLPLLVRSQNFTSAELATFTRAEGFEPAEKNPYLGLRGGLKALLQPDWFSFELATCAAVMAETTQFGIVVPFVRSVAELTKITQKVNETSSKTGQKIPLWLELSTPAAVFGLSQFPLAQVSGVVLNTTHLLSLMHGYDPSDPEISAYFTPSSSQFELVLKHAIAGIKQATVAQNLSTPPVVWVQLESFSPQVVELAAQFGVEGVIVQPQVVPLTKTSIMEIEARPLANVTP